MSSELCAECGKPFRKGEAAIYVPRRDAVWCLECFSPTEGGSVPVHARVYPECPHEWHDMYYHPSTLVRRQVVRNGHRRDSFRRVSAALESLPAPPREVRVVGDGSGFAVAVVVGSNYEHSEDAAHAAAWLANQAGIGEEQNVVPTSHQETSARPNPMEES